MWTGVKCNFSSPHHHVRKIVGKLSIRRVRMWNFTRIGPKTTKLWLSIVPARRPSEHIGLGQPQKGVNCNFSSPEFDKPYGVRNSLSRTLKYVVQQGWPKNKKITALSIFLAENLENFRSTEHYGAPLEGSTIFLCRSFLGSTAMESCRLPELKYAIFRRARRKTKKLRPRSSFYRWPLSIGW